VPAPRSKAAPAARDQADALRIPERTADEILARLRRVEGQVRAVQRMIAERRDCHAIAQQMAAAGAALSRATVQLMTSSMAQCLTAENGKPNEAELERLTETFTKLLA
jgi:DNA-binding FrmR family transcriptional regulator